MTGAPAKINTSERRLSADPPYYQLEHLSHTQVRHLCCVVLANIQYTPFNSYLP